MALNHVEVIMRKKLGFLLVASLVIFTGAAAEGQDFWHTRPWIGFGREPLSIQSGRFQITEEYEPRALVGRIYVRGPNDREPRLIFTNQEYAEILIGHRGELALINAMAGTKTFEVDVADLGTGEARRIDEQALRLFSQNSGGDPSLIIVAAGEALTADDREALLSINLIYISVSTAAEAEKKGKTFQKWWYAVSTASGRVMHEYRTAALPAEWRREYQRSGKRAPHH